jgi:hypothetical protein
MAIKTQTEITSRVKNRSILFSLALLATSTSALAHGEGSVIAFGLFVITFFGCFLAIRLSSYLHRHRLAAKLGAVFGLATLFWPVGSLPYSKYETQIDAYAMFACPIFMLAFYHIAKFMKK